jgi:hypothetical protein
MDPQLPATSYIAKPVLTAQDAIATHVRWKISLLLAARMHEPLSERATRSIEHPEECKIHQWLLSKHTLHLRGTAEHHDVLERHIAFHDAMLRIAGLLNAGEYDQADFLLNSPEPFQNASSALANAITALDRRTTRT